MTAITSAYYDSRETRSADERHAVQLQSLRRTLAHARTRSAYFADSLAHVDPASITDIAKLAALPLVRKSDLITRQAAHPPFGGLNAVAPHALARLFVSPGPIHDPEGHGRDWWRVARALYAAGFRRGDIVHNAFSYHLTPAGAMLESGAHALGCAVVPAGVGQTELQVAAIAALRPTAYVGTPSFLKTLLEKAETLGADCRSLAKALVSGEACPASLRDFFAARGIATQQMYGTADLGLVAYESAAREGLIADEDVIVEIVRPGTGDPVPAGEVGEVVVTTFTPEYPLIRFATGDLSAVLSGISPCGRTNLRIKGWMGRADQTAKVRGMFVHPQQIAEILRRHPAVRRARLTIAQEDGADAMHLQCESPETATAAALATRIGETMRELTKLRGNVSCVPPGTLPNDGKIIDDTRTLVP